MKNIEQVKMLIKKHFNSSPKGVISVGITTQKRDYIFHIDRSGLIESGNGYYGVGSISKTFISSYLCELIAEKKISLADTIDRFIDLPSKLNCPTIFELATHTSGYSKFIPF
jgi:20S proteasome alpha/beta subunit